MNVKTRTGNPKPELELHGFAFRVRGFDVRGFGGSGFLGGGSGFLVRGSGFTGSWFVVSRFGVYRFWVSGTGYGVLSSGFPIQGSGLRDGVSWFGVSRSAVYMFRLSRFGVYKFWVSVLRFHGSGFEVRVLGLLCFEVRGFAV